MLTIRLDEKIIIYLGDNRDIVRSYNDEFPHSLTQAGIAENINMSLERISTTIKELEKNKLVAHDRKFSRSTGRFKNVYFLTDEGLSAYRTIKERLGREIIKVKDLNGEFKEMEINDLLTYLKYIPKAEEDPDILSSKENESFSEYFMKRVCTLETFQLRETPVLRINYTNIINNISSGTVDVQSLLEAKSTNINKRMWIMVRDAYYDISKKCVVLTKNQEWQAGIMWLKKGIKSPFIADFKYKIGGGSGGDGFVFMFYKKKNYWPCDGGNLGFVSGVAPIPGYGIEFDGVQNVDYGDPPYPHLALIKNHPKNHLEYVEEPRVVDSKWHYVKVIVEDSAVTVHIDENKVLEWSGKIERAYDGIGFSASTGGQTNWHMLDDIKIMKGVALEKSPSILQEIKNIRNVTHVKSQVKY
ncbi:MAG: hypothetical protein QXG10_01660 [Candidatus Hadarchaeales archaeon]